VTCTGEYLLKCIQEQYAYTPGGGGFSRPRQEMRGRVGVGGGG